MQGESAIRTVVATDREILADFGPASAALLARAPRIHFHVADSGALSLGSQRQQEAGPSGIADRAGQPTVLEQVVHAQAFGRDEPVATDQLQGHSVVVLPAEPRHPDVNPGNLPLRLP